MERFSQPVRNGLHGHKTRIESRIRDGRVPQWLYPSHPRRHDGKVNLDIGRSDPRTEFLRAWQDIVRNISHRQVVSYRVFRAKVEADDANFPFFDTRPAVTTAPETVCRRCNEYLDSPRHNHEMRTLGGTGSFAGFYVNIVVGPEAGIRSVHLSADYLR